MESSFMSNSFRLGDSVWWSVRAIAVVGAAYSVDDSVWDILGDSVGDNVRDSVQYRVWDSVVEELFEQ